jgi:protein-S-isoprenylcysteine O-methyltransferase Ste14
MAGVALAVPNVLALAGLGAAIIGLQLQVRRIEEPYLLRVHGEDYRAYAAQAGRFLPGIGRLAPADPDQSEDQRPALGAA